MPNTEVGLEEEFWKVVGGRRGVVEVEYGADLDSRDKDVNSAFGALDEGDDETALKYAKSSWNFNRSAKLSIPEIANHFT